ncbi:hypothetical protein BGLT_02809 [Caballeronia glathei]|jgi:hypothetical protein|uniref:Uncharacterized protein n=1 Tax=Caballeronia glathei TaxID=60547 RepID=A0A069PBF3_9BURK|nr:MULTISPECIES: hypothetical protein [Burkholderiaceae]KDR38003.1 hypothetical protein BG61_04685 [Caballeronia glathei]CDY73437.1 hypothetical protein BGLT_02809 [Caballeronia glathei]
MASVEHQTYAYDGLRRLTSVTAQAGNAIAAIVRSKNFSYDLEGNVHTIDSLVLTLVCAGAKTRPVRLTSITDGITAQAVTQWVGGASLLGKLT